MGIVNRFLECCNFNYLFAVDCVFILASKILFNKINYHVMLNDGQNGVVTFATEKMVVSMEQELIPKYSKDVW